MNLHPLYNVLEVNLFIHYGLQRLTFSMPKLYMM